MSKVEISTCTWFISLVEWKPNQIRFPPFYHGTNNILATGELNLKNIWTEKPQKLIWSVNCGAFLSIAKFWLRLLPESTSGHKYLNQLTKSSDIIRMAVTFPKVMEQISYCYRAHDKLSLLCWICYAIATISNVSYSNVCLSISWTIVVGPFPYIYCSIIWFPNCVLW